jgi:hypothetical protein
MTRPIHLDLTASTAKWLLSGERLCRGCGVVRPLSEWAVDGSKRSGFASRCRVCDRERAKSYYRENREAVLERAAAKRVLVERVCSECRETLPRGRRVVCSDRCGAARYRRLHPDAYAASEARKLVRRRARRAERNRELGVVSLDASTRIPTPGGQQAS